MGCVPGQSLTAELLRAWPGLQYFLSSSLLFCVGGRVLCDVRAARVSWVTTHESCPVLFAAHHSAEAGAPAARMRDAAASAMAGPPGDA